MRLDGMFAGLFATRGLVFLPSCVAVASENLPTSGAADHAVKVRVGGLKAREEYFYRFETQDSHSDVGPQRGWMRRPSDRRLR